MTASDARYLKTIVNSVRVCATYKPKFGQGRGDGLTISQFQDLYQGDPFYNWFGLDNPMMYAAHKAAGGMTSVYRQIGTFDPSRAFRPWFLRMVVNEALRATTGRIDLSLDTPMQALDDEGELGDLFPDETLGPEGQAEKNQLRQIVWEAMEQLLPQERAVITLRYYLDYSEQEMVEALNCPPGTVKWRLHDARKHLRTILRPFWQEVK